MKRNLTKSLFISSLVFCVSAASFAQTRTYDRATSQRHNQIRARIGQMDICVELRNDVRQNVVAYDRAEEALANISRNLTGSEREVSSRRSTLSRKRNAVRSANSNVSNLVSRQSNKVAILRDAQKELSLGNATLPMAQADQRAKQDTKNSKCRGLGLSRKCRDAKKALKRAKSKVSTIKSKISNAQYVIRDMNTIDAQVNNARRTATNAQAALTRELGIMPSVITLEDSVRRQRQGKEDARRAYLLAEEIFVRSEVKFDGCTAMKYEARKAPVFKDYLVEYSINGCAGLPEDLRRAQGPAAKAGVSEAFELVCNSENLLCGGAAAGM